MDSFEFNKISGAILAALLLWFGTKIVSESLYSHAAPEKPGYVVAVNTSDGHGGDHGAKEKAVPFPELLAAADPAVGLKEMKKKCAGCHSFTKDGKNKVGPKLWGVYERGLAAVEGFSYSGAFKKKGGSWTAEELDAFLKNPKKHIKGTKMAFNGMKNDKKRAALVKYLGTLK
ncbi:MAG: c-type cytochrome [Methyloligellaceae bacterium]